LGTDQRYADREFMNLLEDTMSVADVNVADYDAIYLPGGHGVMFDFPQSEKLASLITGFYESGKIVSAVCHGPAGLLNVRLSSALTSRWVHHRVDGPVMRGVVLTFAITATTWSRTRMSLVSLGPKRSSLSAARPSRSACRTT